MPRSPEPLSASSRKREMILRLITPLVKKMTSAANFKKFQENPAVFFRSLKSRKYRIFGEIFFPLSSDAADSKALIADPIVAEWILEHQYPTVKKNKKFDIALFGMYWNGNLGGSLTYFALHELLKSAGLSVLTVYMPRAKNLGGGGRLNLEAVKEKYHVSKPREPEKLPELRAYVDAFVLASDQLWYAKAYFSPMIHYLACGDSSVKRISVATSFAHDKHSYTDTQLPLARYLLSQFDDISVREQSGVEILKNFGIKATRILDPVFLCGDEPYDYLENKAKKHEKSDFLFLYLLDFNQAAIDSAIEIKNKMGLETILACTSLGTDDDAMNIRIEQWSAVSGIEFLSGVTVADFIYNMRMAKAVLTDSFHGTCLAVMRHKPFICILKPGRGNARYRFFKSLGLADRIKKYGELTYEAISAPLDWDSVDKKLNIMKEESLSWLDRAFGRKFPRNIFRRVDLVDTDSCTGCAACANVCPASCIEMKADREGFPTPVIDEEHCRQCGFCLEACPVSGKTERKSK